MRKLLIAQHSETLISRLEHTLRDEWEIHICTDSYPVVDMLQYIKPEAMVMDLNLQPKNGLTVLKECQSVNPPIILATTNLITPSIIETAENLGVGCLVRIPFRTEYIKELLNEMYSAVPERLNDVSWHLRFLGVNPKLSGYRCLLAVIPLYKSDPNMLLKEVYPTAGKACGLDDVRNVERAIRTTICNAWRRRQLAAWSLYFPVNDQGDVDKPSNKEFIKAISEKI